MSESRIAGKALFFSQLTAGKATIAVGKIVGGVNASKGEDIKNIGKQRKEIAKILYAEQKIQLGEELLLNGHERKGLEQMAKGSAKISKSGLRFFCCTGCTDDCSDEERRPVLVF